MLSTSTAAFPQEVLDDRGLGVVAGGLGHQGAQLPELPQQAVLMVGVAELGGEGAALASFGS